MHISYFKVCHLQTRRLVFPSIPVDSPGTIPRSSREILTYIWSSVYARNTIYMWSSSTLVYICIIYYGERYMEVYFATTRSTPGGSADLSSFLPSFLSFFLSFFLSLCFLSFFSFPSSSSYLSFFAFLVFFSFIMSLPFLLYPGLWFSLASFLTFLSCSGLCAGVDRITVTLLVPSAHIHFSRRSSLWSFFTFSFVFFSCVLFFFLFYLFCSFLFFFCFLCCVFSILFSLSCSDLGVGVDPITVTLLVHGASLAHVHFSMKGSFWSFFTFYWSLTPGNRNLILFIFIRIGMRFGSWRINHDDLVSRYQFQLREKAVPGA